MRFIFHFVAFALCYSDSLYATPPRLLPFQGRLTDTAGTPLANGSRVVRFRIYDAPTDGTIVWQGELQRLTINGGLISTLLGSKATLESVDFNLTLYLEITVDANADDQITTADPPLLPRQSILPVVFAVEAATAGTATLAKDSEKLAGFGWNSVFDNGNPSTGSISINRITVNAGSIPGNAIADGSIAATKLALSVFKAPTIQTFKSGSGDYVTPAGVLYIRVRMVGGGGGGGGSFNSGANPNSGVAGGMSTFGESLLSANGGGGGFAGSNQGGTGGAAQLNSPAMGTAVTGSSGGVATGGTNNPAMPSSGGNGGTSYFGGSGMGGFSSAGLLPSGGTTNSGSGGGGAGFHNGSTLGYPCGGGGAGGFLDAIIRTPGPRYPYSVGNAGQGGAAGTGGSAGASGGSGYIEVTEYYQ